MIELPTSLQSHIQSNNTKLFPLVIIKLKDKYLGLSTKRYDVKLEDGTYFNFKPLIAKDITISQSIDLKASKFKVSTINLSISNFIFEQKRFSEYFEDYSMLQSDVEIFFGVDGQVGDFTEDYKEIENATIVFSGGITKASHDDKNVNLQIEDKSYLNLKNTQLPSKGFDDTDVELFDTYLNKPIPMVYGDVDKAPTVVGVKDLTEDGDNYRGVVFKADWYNLKSVDNEEGFDSYGSRIRDDGTGGKYIFSSYLYKHDNDHIPITHRYEIKTTDNPTDYSADSGYILQYIHNSVKNEIHLTKKGMRRLEAPKGYHSMIDRTIAIGDWDGEIRSEPFEKIKYAHLITEIPREFSKATDDSIAFAHIPKVENQINYDSETQTQDSSYFSVFKTYNIDNATFTDEIGQGQTYKILYESNIFPNHASSGSAEGGTVRAEDLISEYNEDTANEAGLCFTTDGSSSVEINDSLPFTLDNRLEVPNRSSGIGFSVWNFLNTLTEDSTHVGIRLKLVPVNFSLDCRTFILIEAYQLCYARHKHSTELGAGEDEPSRDFFGVWCSDEIPFSDGTGEGRKFEDTHAVWSGCHYLNGTNGTWLRQNKGQASGLYPANLDDMFQGEGSRIPFDAFNKTDYSDKINFGYSTSLSSVQDAGGDDHGELFFDSSSNVTTASPTNSPNVWRGDIYSHKKEIILKSLFMFQQAAIEFDRNGDYFIGTKGRTDVEDTAKLKIEHPSLDVDYEEADSTNPCAQIYHALDVEGIVDTSEIDYNSYKQSYDRLSGISTAFSQSEFTSSDSFIEDITKNLPLFLSYNNKNQIKFNALEKFYTTSDYNDSFEVKVQDLISYKFTRKDAEKITTRVKFKYQYDYGNNETRKIYEETLSSEYDDDYFDFYGLPNDHSKSTLEVEDKFIREHNSARNTAKRILYNNANDHLELSLDLPVRYFNLEVGDLIHFKELPQNIKPFGVDIRVVSNPNKIIRYPLFIVTSTKKGISKISIQATQLHGMMSMSDFQSNTSGLGLDDFISQSFADMLGLDTEYLESQIQKSYNVIEIANPILGCTDLSAINYNPNANTDDGSCVFAEDINLECGHPYAENYSGNNLSDYIPSPNNEGCIINYPSYTDLDFFFQAKLQELGGAIYQNPDFGEGGTLYLHNTQELQDTSSMHLPFSQVVDFSPYEMNWESDVWDTISLILAVENTNPQSSAYNMDIDTATIKWGVKFLDKELNIQKRLLNNNEDNYPFGFTGDLDVEDYIPSGVCGQSNKLNIPLFAGSGEYEGGLYSKYALLHYLWKEYDEGFLIGSGLILSGSIDIENRPYAHFQITAFVESIGNDGNLQDHTFSFYIKVPYPEEVIGVTLVEVGEDLLPNADINQDGITNVLDVLQIINYILDEAEFTPQQAYEADVNQDGVINILDVILIADNILGV